MADDNDFYVRHRTEVLRQSLRGAGVTFTGRETVAQLEALLTANGVSAATQSPLVLKNALGGGADVAAPSGAAGNINSSTTNGLILADPRLTFTNVKVGQQVSLTAAVTLGINTGTGVLSRLAQIVQSTDAGTTWTKLGRLYRVRGDVTNAPELMVSLGFSFTAATAGTYLFGIQIGNNDNVAGITASGQSRWFSGFVA